MNMLPNVASYDHADQNWSHIVLSGESLIFRADSGLAVSANLSNNALSQFRLRQTLAFRLSSARDFILGIICIGSFEQVRSITAWLDVARMSRKWRRPVTIAKEKSNSMGLNAVAVHGAARIFVRARFPEWPNQATPGIAWSGNILQPEDSSRSFCFMRGARLLESGELCAGRFARITRKHRFSPLGTVFEAGPLSRAARLSYFSRARDRKIDKSNAAA
jgi:hypothetical protein